jgi:hypothetical protein
MTNIFTGYRDDNDYFIDPTSFLSGNPVNFLGVFYTTLYVGGNGGFAFGAAQDNYSNHSPETQANQPCLYMVSNDANLQELWGTVINGTTLVIKVRGNTDYSIHTINYEYDIYFYNNGTADVFVVQEPTIWNNYPNGQGGVTWGLTNGTNWIDGLSTHDSSLGAILSGGKTGLRITGGLRLGGTPAPSKTLTWNGIYYVPLPVGQLQTIELLYSNWDGSTIYVTIFGTGIVSGDFDTGLSGTIDGLTGSGLNTTVQFTATPQAAGKTYQLKFGSSFGASDYLISDPYTISS